MILNYIEWNDTNSIVFWDNDFFESEVEMVGEHYASILANTAIFVNTFANDDGFIKQHMKEHSEQKLILYNLEHKYPLESPGKVQCCDWKWTKIFNEYVQNFDEIWDYNIEDYMYFHSIGCGQKFRFKPLRYTTWFEQFHKDKEPNYDVEFEGAFDTNTRSKCIRDLTRPTSRKIKLKIANTNNQLVKFQEKLDAKFCLDLPHYNWPEAYAARVRLFECICLGKPVITYDHNLVGSKKYFEDMVIYTDQLYQHVIYDIISSNIPTNVSQKFKQLTYNNMDYEIYKRSIFDDFVKISNENIPEFVLC